jgi:hypothetical protein
MLSSPSKAATTTGTFQSDQAPSATSNFSPAGRNNPTAVAAAAKPSSPLESLRPSASSFSSKPSPSDAYNKQQSSAIPASSSLNFPVKQQESPLSALLQPQQPQQRHPSPSPLGAMLGGGGGGGGGGGAMQRDNRHFPSTTSPMQQQQSSSSSSNRNASYNNCDNRAGGPSFLTEVDSGLGNKRSVAGLQQQQQQQQPRYGMQTNGGGADNKRSAFQSSGVSGADAGGGYNFQRIMDDHFEHYNRPPSRPASREQSVDRQPGSLAEAGGGGRVSRPPSRNRTPLQRTATDDFALHSGKSNGGLLSREPSVGGLRQRQTSGPRASATTELSPTSAVGTIPKRTESLYMKIPDAPAAGFSKVNLVTPILLFMICVDLI